jgi:hypothetical protein
MDRENLVGFRFRLIRILTVLFFVVEIYNLWAMYAYSVSSLNSNVNIIASIILPIIIGILCIYIGIKNYQEQKINQNKILFVLFFWLFFNIVKGFFVASNYWDWKSLLTNYIPLCCIASSILIASNLSHVQELYNLYFNKLMFFGLLIIPFTYSISPDTFAFINLSIYFIALFIPFMRIKKKLQLVFYIVLSIILSPDHRTNIVYAGASMLIILSYYLGLINLNKVMNKIRIVLFFSPIIFFSLAVTGTFNILNIENELNIGGVEISSKYQDKDVDDFLVDTRSDLYRDIFIELKKTNSIITGVSGAKGYARISQSSVLRETGFTRYGSEIGMATVILREGIIGCFLYGLIFYYASKQAIKNSKNSLTKLLGLLVLLKWSYFFVGDAIWFGFSAWTNYILLGLCLTPSFREMSNEEINDWIDGVLYKKKYIS